jgi:type VI secretion system protein ImpB
MGRSYQNEIPKARINITLDVATNGSMQKKELPLKLLTVGDFSGEKGTGPVQNRERISINKNNLDGVMQDLSPEISLSVKNKLDANAGDLPVNLTFNVIKDFHPENVARQVPELKRLIAMRNLLKDLKSNLLDNKKLRKELEGVFKDNPSLEALRGELDKLAAIETSGEKI